MGSYSTSTENYFQREIKASEVLFDKEGCSLWIRKEQQLLKLSASLEIVTTLDSNESFLGEETLGGLIGTRSDHFWNYRNHQGELVAQLPAIAQFPLQTQGGLESGFWVLDFYEKEKKLLLIHYNSSGKLIWSHTVSSGLDLWKKPRLFFDPKKNLLWIGYTVTTSTNIYSPRVELWATHGERLNTYDYPHKGVLQDACLTAQGHFLISRDIPSAPYTAPLFSFIDSWDPLVTVTQIDKSLENDLIPSISCNQDQIWALHSSLFGGENTRLELSDPVKKSKLVLSLKDPAWKIHACSLE